MLDGESATPWLKVSCPARYVFFGDVPLQAASEGDRIVNSLVRLTAVNDISNVLRCHAAKLT
jgi:hypothetical protein